MADLIGHLGAHPAHWDAIAEIVRGSTIARLHPEVARDPDHDGDVARITLDGGDLLLLFAVAKHRPQVDDTQDPRPAATLEVGLLTRQGHALVAHSLVALAGFVKGATIRDLRREPLPDGSQAAIFLLDDRDHLRIVARPELTRGVLMAGLQLLLATPRQTRLVLP